LLLFISLLTLVDECLSAGLKKQEWL